MAQLCAHAACFHVPCTRNVSADYPHYTITRTCRDAEYLLSTWQIYYVARVNNKKRAETEMEILANGTNTTNTSTAILEILQGMACVNKVINLA